jgi:hypothetical protein
MVLPSLSLSMRTLSTAPMPPSSTCSAWETWAGNEALVTKILELLSAGERVICRGVCKEWERISDDPLVWQDVVVGVIPEPDNTARGATRSRSTQTDLSGLHCAKKSLALGLRQLAHRCFARTRSLTLPLLPTADLEFILSCAPGLHSLCIYVSQDEYLTFNENGLVAIARNCRNLRHLSHPLPPLHFDSDERLHRSSLRLVCKSNPGLACASHNCCIADHLYVLSA